MIENKLIQAIVNRQREIADGLISHPAEDHAKYNRLVGTHQGLQEALDLLHDLLGPDED